MQIIAGTGMTAPPPQNLYPTQLNGAVPDAPTNFLTLAAGDAIQIPAQSAQYLFDLGQFCNLEYLDAVSGAWRLMPNMAARSGILHMQSDGITKRVVNRTGCPISAVVVNGGSGFAQATAAITPSQGGSTWTAVVGGSLSVSTINNAGANYTVPPLVFIPAPGTAGVNGFPGGVTATAYASIANGTVSGVTFANVGAGYPSAPQAVLVPSPFDVNYGSITNATITLTLLAANQGKITAAICTSHGAALAAASLSGLTLTASGGGGSGATITPLILQTIASSSIVAGGAGWGTATAPANITAVGGAAAVASSIGNPVMELTGFVPRMGRATGIANAGGTITTVSLVDAGLYVGTPTAAIAGGGTLPTTLASITFAMGSSSDTIMLQPL